MPKTPDQKETPKAVELTVRKFPGKNLMIVFEGRTQEECSAYNAAISEILKRENLRPFHQIGGALDREDQPGLHGWEVWTEVDQGKLEQLFEQIHKRASEMLKLYSRG